MLDVCIMLVRGILLVIVDEGQYEMSSSSASSKKLLEGRVALRGDRWGAAGTPWRLYMQWRRETMRCRGETRLGLLFDAVTCTRYCPCDIGAHVRQ